ncbi:MAG: dihydrolipoyl dehydrogenase [Xanthomonadales bacterium]|nr:dihydrolipoyl dehydrogenase [Xanthomonadales bacterium]
MSKQVEIKVPDIGDFTDIPVIEVLVAVGDEVSEEQSLVTLESDKATMELPSPVAGVIEELHVESGSLVSEGSVIAVARTAQELEPAAENAAGAGESESGESESADVAEPRTSEFQTREPETEAGKESPPPDAQNAETYDFDLVVLGAGPGGYTAAFRAADLGLRVALVERYASLGGVCLNVGCIPSKTLLHTAQVIDQAAAIERHGVHFGEPQIDLDKLRAFKDGVVGKLAGGLKGLAKQRKVEVVQGVAAFEGAHVVSVQSEDGQRSLSFAKAIIAVGSQSVELPGMPWGDYRLMDSTAALELEEIPERLLVVGGGIIGLEMACVYEALGSKVTVVELTPKLMPGTDPDLVKPLQRRIAKRYEAIHLATRVKQIDIADDALVAHFEGEHSGKADFDRVLVAVGRSPNGGRIKAEAAGVRVSERGFISVDAAMRTSVPHIFAIGDVVGEPMLAHKATHEGRVAAEVCAGEKSAFDARVIPSVAYTDPEIAWVGVTEAEACEKGMEYGVGKFPWAASGRALGNDRSEGFTKLLFDPKTDRLIGAGITGLNAGDLISECALAIEMGAEASDIALTIHPHPTLSESVGMAAEAYEGTITDLYMPKKG